MSKNKTPHEKQLKQVLLLLEKSLTEIAKVVFTNDAPQLSQFKRNIHNANILKLEKEFEQLKALNSQQIQKLSRYHIERYKDIHLLCDKLNTQTDIASVALGKVPDPDNIKIEDYISCVAQEINQLISPNSEIICEEQINHAFLELIDLIIVSPKLDQHKKTLRNRLIDNESLNWIEVIRDISDLVQQSITIIQEEKQSLEHFIVQIRQQIETFENLIDGIDDDIKSSERNNQTLEQDLDHEIHGMRENLDKHNDIDALKNSINNHIDRFKEKFEDFKENEASRLQHTNAIAQQLTIKVQSLENESANLRKELEDHKQFLLIDSLTGVHSRYAYDKKLSEEYTRWQRYRNDLSYIIFDIDFFKKINDTYGHNTGDRALRMIAQLIKDQKRQSDFFARIGGEEFIMLLPNTSADAAVTVANKIREKVAKARFIYRREVIKITISCGVTSFREGDSIDSVYARADKALYQAKSKGRNRVETL